MGVRISINTKEIIRKQKEDLKGKMIKFSGAVKNKIDEKTPEDKKELIGNTKISEVIEVGSKIAIRIYNDTEHGPYVEYGVEGKTYNYHKGGSVFYSGVGAGMFGRTYEEVRNDFNDLSK